MPSSRRLNRPSIGRESSRVQADGVRSGPPATRGRRGAVLGVDLPRVTAHVLGRAVLAAGAAGLFPGHRLVGKQLVPGGVLRLAAPPAVVVSAVLLARRGGRPDPAEPDPRARVAL